MNQAAVAQRLRRTAGILFGIAIVNFLVFIVVDLLIFNSGRHLDREERELPYVLVQKGSYRQVSPPLYLVDRVYAYTSVGFLLVGIPAGVYSALEKATRPRKSSNMRGAA